MTFSIEFRCDHVGCEQLFDITTTADASGIDWAIGIAQETGWSVAPAHDHNTPAGCPDHAQELTSRIMFDINDMEDSRRISTAAIIHAGSAVEDAFASWPYVPEVQRAEVRARWDQVQRQLVERPGVYMPIND